MSANMKSKSLKSSPKKSFNDTYNIVEARANMHFDTSDVKIVKNTYGGLQLASKKNGKIMLFNISSEVLYTPNESKNNWYVTIDGDSISEDLGTLLRGLSANKQWGKFLHDQRSGGVRQLFEGPHSWANGVTHSVSLCISKDKIEAVKQGDLITGKVAITAFNGNDRTKGVSMKLWAPKVRSAEGGDDDDEGVSSDGSGTDGVERPVMEFTD